MFGECGGGGEERKKKKSAVEKKNRVKTFFHGRESHDVKRINFISK